MLSSTSIMARTTARAKEGVETIIMIEDIQHCIAKSLYGLLLAYKWLDSCGICDLSRISVALAETPGAESCI
jgi:hypothetical protein